MLLISTEILSNYADMTQLSQEKEIIEMHIRNAQENELKDLLGSPLYYDMISNKSSANYVNLIKGEEYECTYNNTTYTVKYQGIQKVLAYWSLARLVKFHGVKITAQGLHTDLSDYSDEVSDRRRSNLVSHFKSEADQSQQDIIDFLENNKSDYPLYDIVEQKNTSFKAYAVKSKNKYLNKYNDIYRWKL